MHEDHVGCPGFVDFAPDAFCIKPTRRARRSPALRETPLCKKAFNSGYAALVSALAALSEPARQRATFWWELFLVFGSFATCLKHAGFF